VKAALQGRQASRDAKKQSTVRMKALRSEPALRCPKCAAAKRIRKPSTQKQGMALSQKPQQDAGSQPSKRRLCEDRQMICVREVLSKDDIAFI